MNTVLLAGIFSAWLLLSYRYYGRLIAKKLFAPDETRPVPSREFADGRDFHAASTPVLFGHHFSSIAGAGPIVGPLIGVLHFGWGAALLWIALGSVFMGAVHDYAALMVSVRNGGCSIAEIAEGTLGHRARMVLSIFLWAALVMVIAVFGMITAKTFVAQPTIVIPTFGLIVVAIIFGLTVLRRGLNLIPGTLIALGCLAALIWLGREFPVALPDTMLGLPALTIWFWILMGYCVLASVLPVWLLLQPRDYLSTWILYLGLGAGILGLLAYHPQVQAPAFVGFSSPTQGPMWPMLFVMIACGAISGFHSLVASGTTSKQLAGEGEGLKVGYGAMILEAGLAGLVVMIAAGALRWDTATIPAVGSFQHLMDDGGGPIQAFGVGFSRLVDALPLLTAPVGLFFGVLMINAFVITTLDTSTRLARFVLQELAGSASGLGNRWIATCVTVGVAGWLGASGSYDTIWPIFGATNQLVAALALLVISSWLLGMRKPCRYTLFPAIFMLLTTIGALLWQIVGFLEEGRYIPAIASAVLVILAAVITWSARTLFVPRRSTED